MEQAKYLVITTSSEDGTAIINMYENKAELIEMLTYETANQEGLIDFITKNGHLGIESNSYPAAWQDGTMLIIKGIVIEPRPKTVVQTWNVDKDHELLS